MFAAIGRGYFDELDPKHFRVLKSGDRIPNVAFECADTSSLQLAINSGISHLVIDGDSFDGKGLENLNQDKMFITLTLKLTTCDDLQTVVAQALAKVGLNFVNLLIIDY